jgi:threonine dehydratase
VPVTIVVPHGNSSEKSAAMHGQGANLIEFGSDFQEARGSMPNNLAAEQSLHFVPLYHRDFLKGIGTYWLELFSAVPDLVVYVPIGMGSGICSGCAVRNGMNLKTKFVGVVSQGAPSRALSSECRSKQRAKSKI